MLFTLEDDVSTQESLDLEVSLDNKLLQDAFLQLRDFFEIEGYPNEYKKPPSSFGPLLTNPFPGVEFKSKLKPYRFDYVIKIKRLVKDIEGSKDLLDIIVSYINQLETQKKQRKAYKQEQVDLIVELNEAIESQSSSYDEAIIRNDEDDILQIENEISAAKKGIRFSTIRSEAEIEVISLIDKNLMCLVEIRQVISKRYNVILLAKAEKKYYQKLDIFLGEVEEYWGQMKKTGFYAYHVQSVEKENLMTNVWYSMKKRIV